MSHYFLFLALFEVKHCVYTSLFSFHWERFSMAASEFLYIPSSNIYLTLLLNALFCLISSHVSDSLSLSAFCQIQRPLPVRRKSVSWPLAVLPIDGAATRSARSVAQRSFLPARFINKADSAPIERRRVAMGTFRAGRVAASVTLFTVIFTSSEVTLLLGCFDIIIVQYRCLLSSLNVS